MIVSLNWLKQYINLDALTPEQVSETLTDLGLEVEGMEHIGGIKGDLKGVVVGHILTCEKHPDADKLSLTTVDVGTGDPLSIVCGAPMWRRVRRWRWRQLGRFCIFRTEKS